MPAAISEQQRQDILLYQAKGFTTKQTRDAMVLDAGRVHGCALHNVPSLRSIRRIRVRYAKHGGTGPIRQRGRQPTMTPEQAEAIREWVELQNDGYQLAELQDYFAFRFQQHRVPDISTISRWLTYLGLTRKKESVTPAQQCQREIDSFWNRMRSDGVLPEEIAWMDEMGFDGRDFLCCYGWSERGRRFETCKRLGRGRRYEALVAMSTDGVVSAELYSEGTIQWCNFADFCVETLFPDMLRHDKKVSPKETRLCVWCGGHC